MDAWLFKLFNGAKSLEEIDQMDIGRLMRSLEAGRLEATWRRWHDPKSRPKEIDDGREVAELKALAKKHG